jgi:outer membrane receptor protein involved in Fe transport
MYKLKSKRRSSVLSASIAMALAVPALQAASAFAQEEELDEIIVTGSRIVRKDFEANSPIVTIESEFFDQRSDVGIENAMNRLPQFVPAATQFDTLDYVPTATNTPGAATLSLRGLAANRSLILLDGRRMMPVNAGMVIDINSIPSAAIQRVETITGGASSVYGADAVAGVVNFILKKDFEGATVDVQYGESEQGDGAETRVSGLVGANFADGRGNVMFGGEYSSRDKVMLGDRDFFARGWADPTVPGDELFFLDTYIASSFGQQPFDQGVVDQIFDQAAPGSVDASANFFLNRSDHQTIYSGGAVFGAGEADGAYRYNSGFFTDGYQHRFIGQNGLINENQYYRMLSIPLDRYSSFGRGSFDFTEEVSGWVQGTFAHTETFTSWQWTPMIGTNWGTFIPHGEGIYAPSLAADGVSTLEAYRPGGIHGLNCPATGGCTKSQTYPVPAEFAMLLDSRPDPEGDFILQKTVDYMPPRSLVNQGRTYQLSFGLEGELSAIDGSWDFTASHGNSLATVNYLGYMSLARYRAVSSAPNFGRGFQRQGNPEAGGFSSGTGFCTSGIPFFFDYDQMTQDCKDAVRVDMMNMANMNQDFAEFNVQGSALDLPAGEMRFSAGAAWRRNDVSFNVDPLSSQNSFTDLPAGNFPTDNTSGQIAVKEIYGELLVPVVNDVPGIQELNLELGYRLSDYDNLKDKIDTWKVLGDWVINDTLRLRGGYQVANRAANIGELFQGATQSFVFGPGDACGLESIRPISANPNASPIAAEVEALCRVLMTPDGANVFYDQGNPQPNGFFAGQFSNEVGNSNLQSEEAETKTFGMVFQSDSTSPWWGPLSLTLDWYEIEINDMIVAEPPIAVYDACLSTVSNPSRDPNHEACQRVLRAPNSGFMLATDVTFQNDGWTNTSGMDLQLNWGSDFSAIGVDLPGYFGINFMANVLLDFETQATSTSPVVDWKGSLGPGPETGLNGGAYDYRLFTTFNYAVNDWSLNLRWRLLPEADAMAQASNPSIDVPQHGAEEVYNVFDLAGTYSFNDSVQVRFGIDNLVDEQPVITGKVDASGTALATSGWGTTNAFYDQLGRRFYFGVRASF